MKSWTKFLENEYKKEYFVNINEVLQNTNDIIYPENKFRAFELTDFDDIRVVILGQDPYHGENQANGLAFSVNTGTKLPPSLKNIFKEIEAEFSIKMSSSGDLTPWTQQGVFLLNTALSVVKDKPNSHQNIGWSIFTDAVISKLNDKNSPIVFVLWGKNAISKSTLITSDKHLILTAPHPSPLSSYRGFFGCNHFKIINEFLTKNNTKEIDWHI